jgi:hypothetical protein
VRGGSPTEKTYIRKMVEASGLSASKRKNMESRRQKHVKRRWVSGGSPTEKAYIRKNISQTEKS